MTALARRLLAGMLVVFLSPVFAFAQGSTTSSISGVVVDPSGAVIPGATVLVQRSDTETISRAFTNDEGVFTVPALDAGLYKLTVSLMGFKTTVLDGIRVVPGAPAVVRATIEVGNLAETVVVEGGSSVVNTQTATIASTLNVDQINKMPLPTRNAINAVTFLPGVNTAGVNRDSNFNGLPDSFVAISLDGVNNNENFNKSTEGLFAMVTPRQDAVEAVTITSAVGGADVGGHGAVQISFVTRSGTNRFQGSAYEYHRQAAFNTNYWFNTRNGLPKNDVRLNQYGIRQGGPIVIPGWYDGRNKAFFFFNYEELRLPNDFSRSRNVLTPLAASGVFRYQAGTTTRDVDLFALAAANGQRTARDPLVQRILGYFNAGMAMSGGVSPQSDLSLLDYTWQSPGKQVEKQPVVRIDYNLTDNHRLNGVYNWQVVDRNPDQLNGGDVRFPNSPNYSHYISYRPLVSSGLRSSIGTNMVNELRGGIRWGPGAFGQLDSNGPQTYADTDGYAVNLTNSDANADGLNLINWHTQNGPTARSAWSWNIDNTLTWLRNNHTIGIGTSFYFGNVWEDGQQMVPGITLGLHNTDPAFNMFNTTTFPGASNAQLTDARELYAMLVGRVRSVTGQAALNEETGEYEYLGKRRRAGKMNEYSAYIQDTWRVTPTLTLSGGVRWDVQMPFWPVNDIMTQGTLQDACGVSGMTSGGACRFYDITATGGKVPDFQLFSAGTLGYQTDWNNFAPNVGVAWQPHVDTGWLRSILGDPDQATVRAGFSIAYDRQGMQRFTEQYGSNPGSTLPLTRSVDNGLLPTGINLEQRDQLYPAPFPTSPSYPIAIRSNRADDVSIFHPDIKVAHARSWTVSLQRPISERTAIEVRYVGTRGVNQWTEENWNEDYNIEHNGFFNEFQAAMQNLQANNAAGGARLGSFAYFGPGTGTNPLPIYLAFLNASRNAASAAAYTGASWTNTTLAGRLARSNPLPYSAAADLTNDATRLGNAVTAGMPANFFLVNPHADDVFVWVSQAYSDYHALQLDLRRRLSDGLQINGSYQYAIEGGSSFRSQQYGRVINPTANVRHAIKMQWDWSLPFGHGRQFGSNWNSVLNGILGGWDFSGAARVQARTLNFGNVRLVGMTPSELTSMFKYRFQTDANGVNRVYILPEDVILNTRRAYSISTTTTTGYSALGVPEGRYIAPANSESCIEMKDGDCGAGALLVRAPFFSRFDIGLNKRIPLGGRVSMDLRMDILNVFNAVNFTPVANPGTNAAIFEVTEAYRDPSNTFDPGGRLGQLSIRLNW